MATVKKRIRRTPEEAKALILNAAKERLQDAGPEGLQVKEVAGVAGVAHSTVLHHFGSAEGVRAALIESMAARLLEDILAIYKTRKDQVTENTILMNVFETLSDGGHARLLAWMMLKGNLPKDEDGRMRKLFDRLVEEIAAFVISENGDDSEEGWKVARQRARYTVMLSALTAVGDGIAGDFLKEQLGLSEVEAKTGFRDWFANLLILPVTEQMKGDR
ncbi:TetR/AcrR family transcriptional regulator [Kordiimonas laminariae]|uniref:TetR/AcrR family transcriptional regulator n=1 Tax=Kordiimonas laminariae TaxID=2917717 RepID=UPI001FF277E2|nr:TetR/AcrR family transcriptional regulator [Kordiimonas laminariae]MCK0069113.1 TetR/AcrR family transcriptional regulator [Kordiimonas laminariae]